MTHGDKQHGEFIRFLYTIERDFPAAKLIDAVVDD